MTTTDERSKTKSRRNLVSPAAAALAAPIALYPASASALPTVGLSRVTQGQPHDIQLVTQNGRPVLNQQTKAMVLKGHKQKAVLPSPVVQRRTGTPRRKCLN